MNAPYRFGRFELNPTTRQLLADGQSVPLGARALDVLLALIERRERLVTKDELLELVWPGLVVEENNLQVQISALRKLLGPQSIATTPGRGYRFTATLGAGEALSAVASPAAASSQEPPSIAVLPFLNMEGDPERDYFTDGITEDIITELSRWRILAVRSRSASFRYRGAAVDIRQAGREMNVRFIVEGSVRRMGERIRIKVQLIDTETGSHVWAERFDREAADIFSIQDQVVQTIVSTLVGRVQASYVERTRRKPPASLDAYECVLKGNALSWNDPNGAAEAKRLFERAVEIDPGYGFAHALLAHMCLVKEAGKHGDRDAALQKAYTLAQRGVELDANESTCFATLGEIHLLRRSFDLALQCMRRATQINPTNQWNAADMGSVLIYVGQADEALDWFKRAKEIDPYFDPPWFWRAYGHAYMILRRYKEALAIFENIPARDPYSAALMAGCHAQLAEMDRARVLAAECLAMEPEFSIGRFMTEEPFKNPADSAHQVACLKMAGLPD